MSPVSGEIKLKTFKKLLIKYFLCAIIVTVTNFIKND